MFHVKHREEMIMAAKFDPTALTVEAADDNAFVTAAVKNNPACEWLRASYESEQSRQVKVPANQVRTVYNMLQGAAKSLNVGCAIRLQWDGKTHTVSKETWEMVKGLGGKHVTILFRAKDRVARPRQAKVVESE
jgi:hypothetical protein